MISEVDPLKSRGWVGEGAGRIQGMELPVGRRTFPLWVDRSRREPLLCEF